MRWRAVLVGVMAIGLLAGPARATTLQSEYLAIYIKLNDSAQLEVKGDLAGALAGFEDCYTRLNKIHTNEPEWENALVIARLGDCRARIIEVEAKVAALAPKTPPPAGVTPVSGNPELSMDRLAELQAAVKTSPNDPAVYRDLGVACFQLGQTGPAIDALGRAVTLDPNNVYAHNYLGCALMKKGRVESAAKEFHRVIDLEEGFAEAHYNLAILYATEDPPALNAARTHYKRALDLGMVPDPHLAKVLKMPQD
jgi:tetratricopeptide (TPR) repeat protein